MVISSSFPNAIITIIELKSNKPNKDEKIFVTSAFLSIFAIPNRNGAVAQMVEQRTENPCVGSSILPSTTEARCFSGFSFLESVVQCHASGQVGKHSIILNSVGRAVLVLELFGRGFHVETTEIEVRIQEKTVILKTDARP